MQTWMLRILLQACQTGSNLRKLVGMPSTLFEFGERSSSLRVEPELKSHGSVFFEILGKVPQVDRLTG